jgi:hypothetical protein
VDGGWDSVGIAGSGGLQVQHELVAPPNPQLLYSLDNIFLGGGIKILIVERCGIETVEQLA